MSRGKPFTPRGTAVSVSASRARSRWGRALSPGPPVPMMLSQIGVSMMPGCMELTRIPSLALAHSMATDLVIRRTAPLVAQ